MCRAFTLIEIMIAVAIIAILAAMSVPMIAAYSQTVQERTCKATMHRIERAAEGFLARTGSYPTGIDDLVGDDTRFFKFEPICAYGHTKYKLTAIEGKGVTVECLSHNEKSHCVNK